MSSICLMPLLFSVVCPKEDHSRCKYWNPSDCRYINVPPDCPYMCGLCKRGDYKPGRNLNSRLVEFKLAEIQNFKLYFWVTIFTVTHIQCNFQLSSTRSGNWRPRNRKSGNWRPGHWRSRNWKPGNRRTGNKTNQTNRHVSVMARKSSFTLHFNWIIKREPLTNGMIASSYSYSSASAENENVVDVHLPRCSSVDPSSCRLYVKEDCKLEAARAKCPSLCGICQSKY